jgi:hypothetical protein
MSVIGIVCVVFFEFRPLLYILIVIASKSCMVLVISCMSSFCRANSNDLYKYSKAVKGLPYKIKSKLEDEFFKKVDDVKIQIEKKKQFDNGLKASRKLDVENIDFPDISPDLKKYVELQKEQNFCYSELQMDKHAELVKKKYQMLELLMKESCYRDDVFKILEYDKATKQSLYISQELVQGVLDNRPAHRTRENERTVENTPTVSHDNDLSM